MGDESSDAQRLFGAVIDRYRIWNMLMPDGQLRYFPVRKKTKHSNLPIVLFGTSPKNVKVQLSAEGKV